METISNFPLNEELSKNKDFSTLPNVEDIYLYNDLMKLTPTEEKEAKAMLIAFLETKFSGKAKYERRLQEIEEIEANN